MAGQWTNKYAIMRDLSLVQGCVPVEVERPVGADDKPPVQEIVEETEEEFFKNCVGDGNFVAPDLGLITQMLDMMRDSEVSSDLEDASDAGIIQISKLNPSSAEFTPTGMSTPSLESLNKEAAADTAVEKLKQAHTMNRKYENGDADLAQMSEIIPDMCVPCHKKVVKKNKRSDHRNVAVTSLLESLAGNNHVEIKTEKENKAANSLAVKLLKPNDFKLTSKPTKAKEEVNVSVEPQKTNIIDKPKDNHKTLQTIMLNPSSMFKKKNITDSSKQNPVPVKKLVKSPPQNSYVPSSLANKYYKEFEQRSKMKQIIQEDIWARAERQMKELDEQRKLEADMSSQLSVSSGTTASSETTEQNLDVVRLPLHRHLLTGECVVCKVLCREEPKVAPTKEGGTTDTTSL